MEIIDPIGWTRQDFIKFYSKVWGCPCIPIANTKKPMVKWAQYQSEMPTRHDYDEWFKSAYGIAIVLRDGLFSIDLDTDEVYQHLKSFGAFPRGTCIYKSKRGYHAIMRATSVGPNMPYSVAEHSDELSVINPLFYDLGIGGVNHLSNMPDTPDRLWLPGYLFDEPTLVDYEEWLETHLGWSKRSPSASSTEGDMTMQCPLGVHEDKSKDSMIVNAERNSAHCFGCGWHGNLWDLQAELRRNRQPVPPTLISAIRLLGTSNSDDVQPIKSQSWSDIEDLEEGPELIKGLLPSGENAKLFIVGPPKIGKTELANTIAVNISRGDKVLGKLEVPNALRTGVGNFEQKGISIKRQIINMRNLYGLPPDDMLRIIDLKGYKLNNPKAASYLLDIISDDRLDLLILDSLYMALDGWNDETQVRALTELFGTIVDKLGCGLILLSHSTETAGGFLGQPSKMSAVSMMGKHLERWAGSYLIYSDVSEAKSRYYGKLEGTIRGGIGFVSYALAYSMFTDAVSIVGWEDVPLHDDMEKRVLRRQDKVLYFQQLVIAAEQQGYTRSDLARALDVDRAAVSSWFNAEKAPGDINWTKIQEVAEHLQGTGRIDEGKAGDTGDILPPRQTQAERKAIKGQAQKGEHPPPLPP